MGFPKKILYDPIPLVATINWTKDGNIKKFLDLKSKISWVHVSVAVAPLNMVPAHFKN